jgi:hypothetical protein
MRLTERAQQVLFGERTPPPADLPADSVPDGVVLRRGRLIPRIGGLLGRMGGPAAAVTLRGTIVLYPGVPLTPALLAHELEHVRQWRADPLFPLRYALASLRHGYHDNPYEVQARQVAASLAPTASTPEPT